MHYVSDFIELYAFTVKVGEKNGLTNFDTYFILCV